MYFFSDTIHFQSFIFVYYYRSNISIEYETSPEASAFQWLRAEQTAGKRQPYLFSQCQVGNLFLNK